MEGLVKLVPCNGKGKTIAEAYIRFNESAIDRIISEGINDKNQRIIMEIDNASEIEENKKYDMSIECAPASKNYEPITFVMKQVLIERIVELNVHAIVTGDVAKQ